MKEHHGRAKQFIRIIALAALESVLLLTVSQVVLSKGLRFWLSRTELQQHAKITLVSSTSIVEGGAHDVILKEQN